MNKSLPINIDLDAIQRDMEKTAVERATAVAREQINRMFRPSGTTHSITGVAYWTCPEGLGHEIVRKKVEEFVLSDKFSQTIDRMIVEHFEEQAAAAVKTLVNSKSRKHLFENIEHKPS